jgi:MFS family permease
LVTITFVYVGSSFVANYGVDALGLTRNQVLAMSAVAGLFFAGGTVLSAFVSDKIGRKPIVGGSQIVGVVWSLALFPILNTGSLAAYGIALCVTMGIAGMAYGAVGAFVPEQFQTSYRYTASGIAYQITGIVGGGVAPLLAPVIIAGSGTTTFGVVLAVLCAIAAVCTYSLRETRGASIEWQNAPEKVQPAA